MFRLLFVAALASIPALGAPVALVSGDPLSCFNRIDGNGTLSTVSVPDQAFSSAIDVKTGDVAATANPWDIRPRCFTTNAAKQNDVAVASFWIRALQSPSGTAFTSFVLEQNVSPFTKSVTYTVPAKSTWKLVQIPFTLAQTYAANEYNLSFWVTFPSQEIQIGRFTILDYGPGVSYSSLGLAAWPYDGHDPNAPWRALAAANIEKYRKGDLVVVARDATGKPVPNAQVRVKMKRHAFGFGTAVAGDVLMAQTTDGQNYRDAILRLFNKVVTENALKWPFYESWGRAQDDFMLPWFAQNGLTQVRGHNVIWPNMSNLPTDVQTMLKATPLDTEKLRTRIAGHFTDVMSYAKGKVTEWDVLNEPFTSRDIQAVLGDPEMAAWFRQARAADPSAKLYVNDYSILEAGGYDLRHINAYRSIIQGILDNGGPLDGIGLQSHFDSNLTPPDRVTELLNEFAAFGKDLQVTEFDINIADDQIQADYTRDFLTVCFAHPAMKGFMIWGFWEGAHWLPRAAMIHKDWSTKPNYAAWNDLIYNQWWTDVTGTTGSDGIYRTRGFLGDYDVTITTPSGTSTRSLTLASATAPAYLAQGTIPAGSIATNGIVNAASYEGAAVAPGELVAIYGNGFGPANFVSAAYDSTGQLPAVVGDTRVLFDGKPAPMIYALNGQVAALVPYSVSGTTNVQVEYLGVPTAAVTVPVATAIPGVFGCGPARPDTAVVVNLNAGKISCNSDYVAPKANDIVTLFTTGEGSVSPANSDGKLPVAPTFPAPVHPMTLAFGGVPAQSCAAGFTGLVYPGVTQINACMPAGVPQNAVSQVTASSGWKVVWSEEFNGAAGTSPDSAKWNYDLGGGGWGNQELESYTSSTNNVYQDGNGNLVIQALKTPGNTYTSARLKTQDKFSVTYGRVEARIKVPYGQGIWPAFWMLGADIAATGWPNCGEIDIMENIGREPSMIHGTVHGPGYSGGNGIGGPYTLPGGAKFADDFHVYGVEWAPGTITFFVDGLKYFSASDTKIPKGTTWVYQHPFFLLLNVAVGGSWPGNPDATSTFPQQMLVDWVRVSQKQ